MEKLSHCFSIIFFLLQQNAVKIRTIHVYPDHRAAHINVTAIEAYEVAVEIPEQGKQLS